MSSEIFLPDNIRLFRNNEGKTSDIRSPVVSLKGFPSHLKKMNKFIKLTSLGYEVDNKVSSVFRDYQDCDKVALCLSRRGDHAIIYILPIMFDSESKFGWCDYDLIEPFEYLRYHLAYHDDNKNSYSIYKDRGK